MNKHIEKALKHLEQNNYVGYFDIIDKLNLQQSKNRYATLKDKFTAGKTSSEYHQVLAVFAKSLEAELANNSEYDTFQQDLTIAAYIHNHEAKSSKPLKKTIETLQSETLEEMFRHTRVIEHFKKHDISSETTDAQKLKALSLMSNGHVIKGTFLCLTSIEQIRSVSHHAHTSKFFAFEDTKGLRTKITEFVEGNLVEQFQQMIRHLKNHLYLVRDIQTRTEDYEVPEQVFTELLANAFIHASYDMNIRTNIKVELYPDRLVIFNPGRFPEEIDLDNIQNIDESLIINPEIVKIFYLLGWIETSAQGIKRSQEILQKQRLKPAVFEQKTNSVKVTIYKEKQTPIQEQFIEAYDFLDKKDLAGFFRWARKYENKTLETLKQEFILGKEDPNFIERLKVFVPDLIESQ